MRKDTFLKKTLVRLIKEADAEHKKEKPYAEIFQTNHFLEIFLRYTMEEMNKAARKTNNRLKKKLGTKTRSTQVLKFIRATPVLQPYLEKYIKCLDKNSAMSTDKAYWLLAKVLRELLIKNNPILKSDLDAPRDCVMRDGKCVVHKALCVRGNEGPFDFFGAEFKRAYS